MTGKELEQIYNEAYKAVYWTAMAFMKNPKLCAREILAGSRVDLQNLTLVDEERNLDDSAGLKRCGLEGVRCGVACKAGIGLRNNQLYERGGLYVKYVTLIGNDLTHHLFLNELEAVGKLVAVQRQHIEGLHVHEVIQISVVVGVLHFLSLDVCILKLIRGVEGSFGYGTRDHVLDLGTNESCTLTGLYVLELDNLKYRTVHIERNAVLKIACYYHFYFPP